MKKVGNFTRETLKNGAKVKGGHRVKYVSEDKEFIILQTVFGYYVGIYLTYESDGAHVDFERTPASQDASFNSLEDCKKFYKVGEFAEDPAEVEEPAKEEVKEEEPEQEEEQKPACQKPRVDKFQKQYEEMKAKHPDAIILFHMGGFYEAYNEDAEAIAAVLSLTTMSNDNRRMTRFPEHALDIYLPKLVRAGRRVCICDQLEDPKKMKKLEKVEKPEKVEKKAPKKTSKKVAKKEAEEPETVATLKVTQSGGSKGMEAMREVFIKMCEEQGFDIDKTCIKQSKEDTSHGTLVGYKEKKAIVEVAWNRKEDGKERKYYIG